MTETLKIEIISDSVCPWCFVGKRRLERALAEYPALKADVNWRPFQLNPGMPAGGMDYQDYYRQKFGDEARISEIRSALAAAGREEGIDFHFEKIKRAPNSLASHRVIRWAGSAGVQDAVVEGIFLAYFSEGQDIGESDVLIEIAGNAGMDAALVKELLRESRDLELVTGEIRTAQDAGITGVPFFILNGEAGVPGAQDVTVFTGLIDDILARER